MAGITIPKIIKSGILEKRSQNKSFFTKENYQSRYFELETGGTLSYYSQDSGPEDNRILKGSIDLSNALVVETVQDGALTDKQNIFQVTYKEDKNGDIVALYVIAPSANIRDSWVSAIRKEAQQHGAVLLELYHDGVWNDKEDIYTCCLQGDRSATGCQQASQQQQQPPASHLERPSSAAISQCSMASSRAYIASSLLIGTLLKRAQGKSTWFPRVNYKKRTFVLDANSLRYYNGDVRLRKNEKARVHLSCITTVENADIAEKDHYENVFLVEYYDNFDLLRLYIVAKDEAEREKWVKAIKQECMKSGAEFHSKYHPGLWSYEKGIWYCCNKRYRDSEGCNNVNRLPEMKFYKPDMNTSVAESVQSRVKCEIKVGVLLKKPQGKSMFFSSNEYKRRVFSLDSNCLAFYDGYLEDKGELKGSIPIVCMVLVEPVNDGYLDDYVNGFQVGYYEDKTFYILYAVADSSEERTSWVAAIKREAVRSRVSLMHRYHPGVYVKNLGSYNCCKRRGREAVGCIDVTGLSLASVRDRLNTMDSTIGIRNRLGTLERVPENHMVKSYGRSSPQPVPKPREKSSLQPSGNAVRPSDEDTASHPNAVPHWTKGITNMVAAVVGIKPSTPDGPINFSGGRSREPSGLERPINYSGGRSRESSNLSRSIYSGGRSREHSGLERPVNYSGGRSREANRSVNHSGGRSKTTLDASRASSGTVTILNSSHYTDDFESVSDLEL